MPSTKRKRRETFGAIRKRDSGRYQASFLGTDGTRHHAPSTFDTMTDARAWLSGQRAKMVAGTWRSPSAVAAAKVTFGEYATRWVDERSIRDRTRAEYTRLLAGPLEPFRDVRLSAVKSSDVRSWYSTLEKTGRVTTAARAYGLLRAIYSTAVADNPELIPSNPAQVRGAQTSSTGRTVSPPTPAELSIITETITPRFKAAVVIAAWGGLRYGELTELRRRDVAVSDDSILIDVNRAVTHVPGGGFRIGKTKSAAGIRQIVLPPHVREVVTTHLAEHTADGPESLLFPAADGSSHLAQSSFTKHWYPARAAAGRADLPWHGLRHHGATRYALSGATLKELMVRLGHTSPRAALIYQHDAGRDVELASRMSELANET